MNKNTTVCLVFVLIVLIMFGALMVQDINKTKTAKIAMEKGYEQCIKTPNSINKSTIWVKDCKAYTNMIVNAGN